MTTTPAGAHGGWDDAPPWAVPGVPPPPSGSPSDGGVSAGAAAVRALAEAVASLPAPEPGRSAEAVEVAEALLGLRDVVEAALLAQVAAVDADGIIATNPALTPRAWLRTAGRLPDAEAGALLGLARRLHHDRARGLRAVAAALADGRLTRGQAEAIARATRRAPAEIVPAVEAAVLATGTRLGPDELARHVGALVERLVVQAAPPLPPGDPAAERFVRLLPGLDGWFHLTGLLEPDTAARLGLVLDQLAAPAAGLDADGGPVPDPRTRAQRWHDALGELATTAGTAFDLLTAMGDDGSPVRAPRPTSELTVLVDADRLLDATATPTGRLRDLPGTVARTPEGTAIPGPAAEHLCCDPSPGWMLLRGADPPGPHRAPAAGPPPPLMTQQAAPEPPLVAAARESLRRISPALGGAPLSVLAEGRAKRVGTPAQRRAAAVRDRGCAVAGCTAPWWRCELHHLIAWILGGRTDLDAMAMICPAHHRFLHRYGWTLTADAATGRFHLQPPGTASAAA